MSSRPPTIRVCGVAADDNECSKGLLLSDLDGTVSLSSPSLVLLSLVVVFVVSIGIWTGCPMRAGL